MGRDYPNVMQPRSPLKGCGTVSLRRLTPRHFVTVLRRANLKGFRAVEAGISRYRYEGLLRAAEGATTTGIQRMESYPGVWGSISCPSRCTELHTSDHLQISQKQMKNHLSIRLRRHYGTTKVRMHFSGWKRGKEGTT